ncbi:MAG TPA: ATP-binding protein [Gemmatimonadaceae bacterium]|nr:ATP-binding protein [Gemmatimonadaceae bacterium]
MASDRPPHATSLTTHSGPAQPSAFERRILLLALLAGTPGGVVALALLWTGDYSDRLRWTLTIIVVGAWLGVALALRERVVRPLQTISNMLAALREGDFSIRARGAREDDALGLALLEVNTLGETLRSQRLGALEATALLRTVMAEIDVAIFAFDEHRALRLVNGGGVRLLDQPAERLLGRTSAALGLTECLRGEAERTVDLDFPGGRGKWQLRRGSFRQDGLPHQLVVLSDLSRALREEERQAWQRLIRVLGHEINNSLAPIKSIAASLRDLLSRPTLPGDWREDVGDGLAVIAGRSESLSRFMAAYALLARLPNPQPRPVEVEQWVRRVAHLETRLHVQIAPGPPVTIPADGDQLDQLLINLVRNAADASLETHGGVTVGWTRNGATLEVWVRDDGLGVSDTANLFVPFFTTKPNGSGIGLALSRQIAEAHGGALTLENRRDARGCEARLRLPL